MKGKAMNEEIKRNEISEEQLEMVSGGTQENNNIKNCPVCGNRMSISWDVQDGVEVVGYYFCRKCHYHEF